MRVTGLKQFLGGADQSIAREILRGEKRIIPLTVRYKNGTPVNFTNATLSAIVEFYRASIEIGNSRANITNLTRETTINDRTLTLTPNSDPTTGKSTLIIPEDLATKEQVAPADSDTNVLVAIFYITYNLGANRNILKHRLLIIIRYAP